jgi:circadian clock protein KaiC
LAQTGNAELDAILKGGLPANAIYLVEGTPGCGKTTLAMQFLMEAARNKEPCLYVTLSETKEELLAAAASHGWSLEGIDIFELVDPSTLELDSQYTMFQPSEVELNETTKAVLAEVDRLKPRRLVFDSLSEMRLLAQSALRYRRQILALKHFFAGRKCSVMLLDDKTSEPGDGQLQSIAHGVIQLEQLSPDYGSERRRLRVSKLRGRSYVGGYHDFVISRGGLRVFPRLGSTAGEAGHRITGSLPSGVPGIDALLGGGLDRGTSILLTGPAGAGKSSVAVQYAVAAAKRGERAALFIFDESREVLLRRSAGLGMDLEPHLKSGAITLREVDPAELSPGEFAHCVMQAVDGSQGEPASVVLIDSLNGYLNSMPQERFLIIQLHELLAALGKRGVVTFLILAQHGLIGADMGTPVDTSYLADSVVVFRYFETAGQVRQAISVFKKRGGAHERTIREFRMSSGGLHVGEPLKGFEGVLTGVPAYHGAPQSLLEPRNG